MRWVGEGTDVSLCPVECLRIFKKLYLLKIFFFPNGNVKNQNITIPKRSSIGLFIFCC